MGKEIVAKKGIDTNKLKHADWLEYRKKGLGGSDIAAAIGFSPWKSQYELYLEKKGLTEPTFSDEAKERMDIGKKIEDFIVSLFQEKHPEFTIELHPWIYHHVAVDWAIANIDRILYSKESRGILEIKNVGEMSSWSNDWKNDEIPFYYMAQIQHYMFVSNLDWAYLACLVGGNKYRDYHIKRDDELITLIESQAGEFWSMVESGQEPPVDGLKSTSNKLAERYPGKPIGQTKDLSHHILEINRLKHAKNCFDEAEAELELHKNHIKRLLENADTAIVNGQKMITWKTQSKENIDSKRLKVEHPDIVKNYINKSESRVFKIL